MNEPSPRPEKPPKPPDRWGVSSAAFYDHVRLKPVRVVFLDGKALTGLLVGVDTYDFLLELDGKVTALIPKHAVKYILPAPQGSGQGGAP